MGDFIEKQIDFCNDRILKAEQDFRSATDPDERARLYERLQLLDKQKMGFISVLEKSYEPGNKRRKESEVSVSGFSTRHWGRLSTKARLRLDAVTLSIDSTKQSTKQIVQYVWEPTDERQQTDACLEHLRTVLPLTGSAEQHLTWYNCANDPNLLTVTDREDVTDFRSIAGTSDIAIITRASHRLHVERRGLCILFELKKPDKMNKKATYQALCQVVLANIHSPELKPVVVLTDLRDSWQMLWMTGSAVKMAEITGHESALETISYCIQQAAALAELATGLGSATTIQQPACPPGLPAQLTAREPVMLPAGGDADPDVGNLADLEGFLPDDEVRYARAGELLQRLLVDVGAWPLQPAHMPCPDMYV